MVADPKSEHVRVILKCWSQKNNLLVNDEKFAARKKKLSYPAVTQCVSMRQHHIHELGAVATRHRSDVITVCCDVIAARRRQEVVTGHGYRTVADKPGTRMRACKVANRTTSSYKNLSTAHNTEYL